MSDIKTLDYLMLIFIVGVLVLILNLLMYKRLNPSKKAEEPVEEEAEDVEGYDNKKIGGLFEGMEGEGKEEEKPEEEEDEGEAQLFCSGEFCTKKVEGFSFKKTIRDALKSSF
jgi:hypothetical protein